jgi:drug/metabolite transporter (DMT)-like permease
VPSGTPLHRRCVASQRFSLAHLPVAFSSLTLLLQPVTAALLAWWLLNEPLRAWQSIGALMVLWAIVPARLAQTQVSISK